MCVCVERVSKCFKIAAKTDDETTRRFIVPSAILSLVELTMGLDNEIKNTIKAIVKILFTLLLPNMMDDRSIDDRIRISLALEIIEGSGAGVHPC